MERAEFLPSKEKTSMKELHIHVGFTHGRKFCCPEEEEISMTAYDTSERIWRHTEFFQYKTHVLQQPLYWFSDRAEFQYIGGR